MIINDIDLEGPWKKFVAKDVADVGWCRHLEVEKSEPALEAVPQWNYACFQGTVRMQQAGTFMGRDAGAWGFSTWDKQILDDFSYFTLAHALWYQRPSHLIDAVSQESARGAQSDCAHLKRLEYQVAK